MILRVNLPKKNFSANNEIEKVIYKNIGKCSIKSNTNDINSISKYITYGNVNVCKSNLFQISNIVRFIKE